jgi:hypothetical protein
VLDATNNPAIDPNEANVQTPMPMAGAFRNLAIRPININPWNTGTNVTLTIRKNGVDSSLALSVNGPPTFGAIYWDTTHSIGFAAGDLFSVRIDVTGTIDNCYWQFALQYS